MEDANVNHSWRKTAARTLLAALLLLGPLDALCGRPRLPAAEKPAVGSSLHGVVQAVDAGKNTLTVAVAAKPGAKETVTKTLPLAPDARILLQDLLTREKGKPLPEGKLTDLTEGTVVDLQLTPDDKAVAFVNASGPGIQGYVKAYDPARNTLTVAWKDSSGPVEKTFRLPKEAVITLDDGIGPKGQAPKEGQPSHLTEGAPVRVEVTVDRKTVRSVAVQGRTLVGTVKGYDVGARALTVTVKEEAQVVDRTFTLAKEAKVEGELKAGVTVHVRLTVADPAVAAAVRARE